MRALNAAAGFAARIWLAGKYYIRLDYSWHLAWMKAAR